MQLSDLPLNKLTHSTTTLPSNLTLTSTNPFHKRVLADRLDRDRLDKLQRICTGGAEGQPGVLSQVGFEPTLHQYSTSLPSAPSPSTSNAASRISPTVTIPHSSVAQPTTTLSPISASADSARFFQASSNSALQSHVNNSHSLHRLSDASPLTPSAAAPVTTGIEEPLQPPKRRSTSFLPPPRTTSSSSFNFQPLVPSPASAFAAPSTPPIAENEQVDTDSAPAAAAQRNTLLHYWTAAAHQAVTNTTQQQQQQQHDDTADIQIIDTTDTNTNNNNTEKKPKPTPALSSAATTSRRTGTTETSNKRKAPTASGNAQSAAAEARLREQLERKEAELREREKQLEERERDREREWQRTATLLRHEQQAAVRDEKDRHARYKREVWDVLAALLKDKARSERAEADRQLLAQQYKVGRMVTRREGMGLVDCWEEGEKVRALREQMTKLYRDHEQLVEHNKRAKRRHTNIKARGRKPTDEQKDNSSLATSSAAMHLSTAFDDGFARPAPVDLSDRYESNDTYTLRIDEMRAEMTACQQRLDKYDRQKKQIIRLTKLHADEQTSRFRSGTVLHAGQYIITELLGKGGFSEVFKAWDCEGMRWVAVKVHQLNSGWPTERKNNYVRHATREYNIHQQLQHKHVVRLLDSFALTQQANEATADTDDRKDAASGGTDADGFVTVLEYCDEHDLDYMLKLRGTLSEKHARAIIAQVFSALAYFSSHASPHRIIHYDLKPGNILFHHGQVKVTDFGLSKILHSNSGTDNSAASSMELTSQGAGTYWYLPPECFPDNSGDITMTAGGGSGSSSGAMISSKVDIFSAGVILYQMLTGKKPFGHGQSPAALLHASIMKRANGRLLEWPVGCAVSEVTREFVQRCLSARPEDRPSIERIFDDPFFHKDAFTQKRKAVSEATR